MFRVVVTKQSNGGSRHAPACQGWHATGGTHRLGGSLLPASRTTSSTHRSWRQTENVRLGPGRDDTGRCVASQEDQKRSISLLAHPPGGLRPPLPGATFPRSLHLLHPLSADPPPRAKGDWSAREPGGGPGLGGGALCRRRQKLGPRPRPEVPLGPTPAWSATPRRGRRYPLGLLHA